MKLRRKLAVPAALVLTMLVAHAHAHLDYSEPAVGATLGAAPPQVKIHFTERLQHEGSSIQVLDAAGHEVDRRNPQVDAGDNAVMAVSLPKLLPGVYKVEWSATARDGHHTTGTFTFTIGKP